MPASTPFKFRRDFRELQELAMERELTLAEILGGLRYLTGKLEDLLMDPRVIAKIKELGAKESSYQAREDAIVAGLTAQRDALQAKIDSGQTVDATDTVAALDELINAIPSEVPPSVEPSA